MILTIQLGQQKWGSDKVLHVEIPPGTDAVAIMPETCVGALPNAIAHVEINSKPEENE